MLLVKLELDKLKVSFDLTQVRLCTHLARELFFQK